MNVTAVRRLIDAARAEAEGLGVTVGDVLLACLLLATAEAQAEADAAREWPLPVEVVNQDGE